MQYQFVRMHTNLKRPSSLIIPNDVNKRLVFDTSRKNMPPTKSKDKYKENLASWNLPSVPIVKPSSAITSTQPPMIWFPGNSGCENEESGNINN